MKFSNELFVSQITQHFTSVSNLTVKMIQRRLLSQTRSKSCDKKSHPL